MPADYGQAVWEALWAEGEKHDACAYGTEAMHVLRAEKGYIIVGQETDGTVTPNDAGLEWAIGKKKVDFVGIRGMTRPDLVAKGRKQLVGLKTKDPNSRARGRRADRRRSKSAYPDEDDRTRHVELLVRELRPFNCAGSGGRWAQPHGRDALSCRCRTKRSKWKSPARCSSTRRGIGSMAKAPAISSAASPFRCIGWAQRGRFRRRHQCAGSG